MSTGILARYALLGGEEPVGGFTQEDPEWTAEKELCIRNNRPYTAPQRAERVSDANFMADEASEISVGSRCEVQPGAKRGTVRWAFNFLF